MDASPRSIATPAAQRASGSRGLLAGLPTAEVQIFLAVVFLFVVFWIAFPDSFATSGTMLNMARVAGILLVAAIGQSFALIVGGFDISVGATMGLVSVVSATLMLQGIAVPLAIGVGILAATAVGLVNGFCIAFLSVTPFVMTLGMLTAARGLADYIGNGGSLTGLPRSFALFGRTNWYGVPSSACIAATVFVIGWFVLRRTRAGLYIYAIGGGREAARVSGMPVRWYEMLAYTLCGALAGVAGLMLTSRVSVAQGSMGQGYELLSVATAVIGGVAIGGGVGRLSGVLIGVLLITVLTTGLDIAGVNPFIQQMVTGCVLVAAVIVANARGGRLRDLLRAFRMR